MTAVTQSAETSGQTATGPEGVARQGWLVRGAEAVGTYGEFIVGRLEHVSTALDRALAGDPVAAERVRHHQEAAAHAGPLRGLMHTMAAASEEVMALVRSNRQG